MCQLLSCVGTVTKQNFYYAFPNSYSYIDCTENTFNLKLVFKKTSKSKSEQQFFSFSWVLEIVPANSNIHL